MRGETSRLRTKLWGPKRESGSANGEDRYHVMVFPVDRSPAKASEDVITDVDGYLLEMFFQNGCRMCRIQSRQGVEIPVFETIPLAQLSLALTSQVFKSAILMFWSNMLARAGIIVDQYKASDYLHRCYRCPSKISKE